MIKFFKNFIVRMLLNSLLGDLNRMKDHHEYLFMSAYKEKDSNKLSKAYHMGKAAGLEYTIHRLKNVG